MNNQDVTGSATTLLPAPTTPEASTKPPKPRRSNQEHGLSSTIRGRYKVDIGQMDKRSARYQALAAYKADLISDLGGKDSLSTAELTLIDLCAEDWLLLQEIDVFLLSVGSFHRKKRAAYALTMQRCTITESLTRMLQAIGLKRRAKPAQTLVELLKMPHAPMTEGTKYDKQH
jgi:hypothetical protein